MLQCCDTLDNPWASVLPVSSEVGGGLPSGRRDGANLKDDIGSTLKKGEGGEELHDRAEFADSDEQNLIGCARIGGDEPRNLRWRKFDGFSVADLADDPDLGKALRRGKELLNPALCSDLAKRDLLLIGAPLWTPKDKCRGLFAERLTQGLVGNLASDLKMSACASGQHKHCE